MERMDRWKERPHGHFVGFRCHPFHLYISPSSFLGRLLLTNSTMSYTSSPMTLPKKFLVAGGFLLFLGCFAAVDAFFTKDLLTLPGLEDDEPIEPGFVDTENPPLTGTGVTKQSGPDVLQALNVLQVTSQNTDTQSLLRRVIPESTPVTTLILLKDGDRVGLLSWVESPQVKVYFLSLKEALHTSFSPQMADLVDETQKREGKPIRNFLTFLDPGIDPERLVFIRVRDRLYEFHIAEGKDDSMFGLVESLTN